MEEEDSCFARYIALQVPCVLQNIFMYLPHADLKRSRLVSRAFNDEASRVLRKRSKIVLNTPKRLISFFLEKFTDVHTFCEGFQLVNVHVATPSMQLFVDNCSHSIKSFDLRDSKWTFPELKEMLMKAAGQLEEVIIHGLLPKDLWSNTGSVALPPHHNGALQNPPPPMGLDDGLGRMLLQRYYMYNNNNPAHNNVSNSNSSNNQVSVIRATGDPKAGSSTDSTEKDKIEEVFWLPKVKRVDLQLYDKLPEDDSLQGFIVKVLTATRNLEILRSSESRKGKSRRERFHRILFETLIDPKFSLTMPKLTKIDFSLTPWGDEQYCKLSSKNFPLTYLSLTILPDISTNTVVKLLTSFKSTLLKLKISFTSWQIMEFPDLQLECLRHLSLDWYNGSLKFISYLTNLETLILAQVDLNEALRDEFGGDNREDVDEWELQQILSQRKHRLLANFELYQPSGAEIFPESVRRLSAIFPNLKRLVLGKLTDQSLRAVFTVFPRLEEFSAIEGNYTDEGVTGISVQPCHICDKQHLTELCRGMYNEILITSQRRHCYIGDLKNLRKLVLKAPNLTNLSVYHGILQCKRLRNLTLRSFHLTYGSLRRIVEAFNLEYLETTHTFSHHAEIKYALKRMNGKTFVLNGIQAPARYNSRDVDTFLSQFSFVPPRPVIQIQRNDRRPLRHTLGLILDSLTHTGR